MHLNTPLFGAANDNLQNIPFTWMIGLAVGGVIFLAFLVFLFLFVRRITQNALISHHNKNQNPD